jgi:hypothetical protein
MDGLRDVTYWDLVWVFGLFLVVPVGLLIVASVALVRAWEKRRASRPPDRSPAVAALRASPEPHHATRRLLRTAGHADQRGTAPDHHRCHRSRRRGPDRAHSTWQHGGERAAAMGTRTDRRRHNGRGTRHLELSVWHGLRRCRHDARRRRRRDRGGSSAVGDRRFVAPPRACTSACATKVPDLPGPPSGTADTHGPDGPIDQPPGVRWSSAIPPIDLRSWLSTVAERQLCAPRSAP